MEKEYWENYYKKHRKNFENSDFSKFVLKYMSNGDTLIDLGCGNGRDSFFFSDNKIKVTGIDQCEEEINYLVDLSSHKKDLSFVSGDFIKLNGINYNHAYSRFTLQSITEENEDLLINWVKENIDGYFFIECRSDKDSLVGVKTDHFRRFINFESLIMKLVNNSFLISYAEKSKGFSPYKKIYNVGINELNPILIRIVCSLK